jgi:hypothetical protein
VSVWTDGDDCAFLGAVCWVGEADDVLVVGGGGFGGQGFTVLSEYGLVRGRCRHRVVVVVVRRGCSVWRGEEYAREDDGRGERVGDPDDRVPAESGHK